MKPTIQDEERARAWWACVSNNKEAAAPTTAEQLALVSWTRFLPHIIGYIAHPIPELQRAALSSLNSDEHSHSTSLAITQLAKTPERFTAPVLDGVKPGLAMMVETCRDSVNFADLLVDFLDDDELEGEYD